jgi:hypothetical protein
MNDIGMKVSAFHRGLIYGTISDIHFDGLRSTTRDISQNNSFPLRDLLFNTEA